MEFSHYDVVPGNIQKTIVDKAVLKKRRKRGSKTIINLQSRCASTLAFARIFQAFFAKFYEHKSTLTCYTPRRRE